jgi:hypothetical protein
VKYWQIIAGNLSKAGWSWGCVSTIEIFDQLVTGWTAVITIAPLKNKIL